MTKIVKSAAVVDDRSVKQSAAQAAEPLACGKTVIKRRHLAEPRSAQPIPCATAPREAYLDELNRIRVEIAQAKDELRALKRDIARADEAAAGPDPGIVGTQNLDEHARALLENAQARCEQILAQAEAQGRFLEEQARNEGYLEGFSKGYEEAAQEFRSENEPKVRQIGDMIETLSQAGRLMVRKNEQDLVSLVVAVAEKVIGRALDADPLLVVDMLRQVVEDNHREQFIKISISRELMPVEAQATEEIRRMLCAMGANVTVLSDPDLPRGSLIVETDKGYTDLSVGTQLGNLRSSLAEQ